jgi:hypothetical protein
VKEAGAAFVLIPKIAAAADCKGVQRLQQLLIAKACISTAESRPGILSRSTEEIL